MAALMRLLVFAFATAALLGVSTGAQGSAADPAPAALCTSLQAFSDTLTELQGFEELGAALTGTQLSPTAQKALDLPRLFNSSSAFQTALAGCTNLGALEAAINSATNMDLDGDGRFSLEFENVSVTNEENPGFIDIRFTIKVQRQFDLPVDVSAGGIDIQGGGIQATAKLTTEELHFQYDTSAATPAGEAFYLIGEPKVTAEVNATGTTGSVFHAQLGVLEADVNGSATLNSKIEIALDDPDDVTFAGQKHITLDEFVTGGSTSIGDLVHVSHLDGTGDDLNIRLGLDAEIAGSDLVSGQDCDPTVAGEQDAFVAITDANLSAAPVPAVAHDFCLLSKFQNMNAEDVLGGLIQFLGGLAASQNAGDVKLPFLNTKLTEVFSATKKLSDFIKEQSEANVICGPNDAIPPTGDRKALGSLYCQAVTTRDVTGSSVLWTVTGGGAIDAGDEANAATVGTAPTENVHFTGITADSKIQVQFEFTDDPAAADPHKATPRFTSIQELAEKLDELELLSAAGLAYDPATTALTYDLSFTDEDPAPLTKSLPFDFGDQLKKHTNLFGLSPDNGATATLTPSDVAVNLKFGALLVDDVDTIEPDDNSDPDFAPNLADRFFLAVGSGDEVRLGNVDITATVKLKGRVGFLEVGVEGKADANPDDSSAAFKISKESGNSAPMLAVNVDGPGVQVGDAGGTDDLSNALLVRQLLDDPLAYVHPVCNVAMSAGLGAEATVGEGATERTLASGSVGISWPKVFQATSCTPRTSGTDSLNITTDTEFASLKDFELIPDVTGVHGGGNDAPTLTDTDRPPAGSSKPAFPASVLNATVTNQTDGSHCIVLTKTDNTLTCTLSGGRTRADGKASNKWHTGDEYVVEGNPLVLLSLILDNLQTFAEQLEEAGLADLDQELPLVNTSPRELIQQIDNLKRTIDELRGAPSATITCGREDANPPNPAPASDSDPSNEAAPVPDNTQIFCQAATIKPVTSAVWRITKGGTGGDNVIGLSGTHTGDAASLLSDENAHFLAVASLLDGLTLRNVTQDDECEIDATLITEDDQLPCLAGISWAPGDEYQVGELGTAQLAPSARASFTVNDGDPAEDDSDLTTLDEFQIQLTYTDADGEHTADFPTLAPPQTLQDLEKLLESKLGLGAEALKIELKDLGPIVAKGTADNTAPDQVLTDADAQDEAGAASDFNASNVEPGFTLRRLSDDSTCTIDQVTATTLRCQTSDAITWASGDTYQVMGDGTKDLILRLGYGFCTDDNANATTNENSVVGACAPSDKLVPKPKAPFKLELPDSVVSSDLFGLETDGSFELEFAARAQLDVALSLNLVPQTKVLNTTRIELKGGVSSPALNLMANVGPLKLIIGGGPDGVVVTDGSHSEANTDPLATVLTDSGNDFLAANVPVGAKLINTTTSQQCVVSAVAQHTLTCGTGIEWHENDVYEVRTVSSAKMGASFDLRHPAITDSNGNNVPFASTGALFSNIVGGYLSGLDPNFDGTFVDCNGADVDFDGGAAVPEPVEGDACARLPLALEVSGSEPEYLGDLAFRISDITSPSPQFYVPPDLLARIADAVLDWDVLLRALAEQLREIEGTLNGAAQDIEFPLIGGALDGGAAVAHKLSEFVDQLANLAQQIESAADQDSDSDVDPADLAAIVRAQIDTKAGDLLRDINGDGTKDADDVVVTFLCGSSICGDGAPLFNIDDVRITFEIGQGTETCGDGGTCVEGVDIPFDIGLKGLPLRAAGALHTEAGWKLKIDFGLSRDKGPYLVSHGPAGFEETSGGHSGGDDADFLTDADRDFTGADEVEIGSLLINTTDDADGNDGCYVTQVTANTLSCDDPATSAVERLDWDDGDLYKVIARHGPDSSTAGTGDPELKVGASIELADAPDACEGDPFNAGDPSSGGDPGPLDPPNFDDNRCLVAELGFLQVNARDGDDSGSTDTDHSPSKAEIHASADFKSSEAKVGIGDLGTVDLDFDIRASANVDLRIRTGFRGQSAGFPSVLGAFHFRFDTGSSVDTSTDETTDTGWIEELKFDNLYLDAGSFLSQYLQPIAKEIKRLTGPLQPVIQTLRSPIPVVSDIAEAVGLDPITFIELMEAATGADLSLVESVMAFIDFARRIGTTSQSLLIPLGGGLLGGAFDVNPTKAIGPAQTPDQAGSLIANPVGGTGLLSNITGSSDDPPGDRPGTFGVPGLTFPFMENAGQIFGVLMGKDATLIRYDAGPLEACAGFGMSLPPFFIGPVPVTVGFGGSACVSGRFVIGYDTSGLRKVLSGASGLYLFDGIFLDDLDDSGQDVPEITFTGEVFVSAGVSIYIFTAGLEGGIRLSTMLDLDDRPNPDGKLHIEEIFNKLHNPICLFIVSGKIEAFLRAFLKIDLFLYTKTFRFELVKITLLDFSLGCDPPNPNLADVVGGNLVLNMGDRADLRGIQTDVVDESFIVRQLDTSGGNTTFSIDAFGIHEEETIPNSGKIIANGSDGDDSITLLPGASSAPTENGVPTASIPFTFPAEISGGDGADEIGTGGGNDKVWGDNKNGTGTGPDQITTGAGVDEAHGGGDADGIDLGLGNDSGGDAGAFGEAGDDTINGAAGADFLSGGAGDDSLEGGPGLDPASTEGIAHPELTDGADELRGGPGNDGLNGSFGNDVMYGDEVLGTAGSPPTCGTDGSLLATTGNGMDSLTGGQGADKMWGGNNQDRLEGNEGDDFLCGGGGNDSGDGGIFGQAGNDEAHGGAGHDFVDGSDGHDNLFGDAGNDTVIGGAGADDARGGNGKDIVRGNTGNDVLLGDAGGIGGHSEANHDGNPASISVTPGDAPAFGTAVNCNALGILDGNADCIYGGDGADLMFGEGGNDQMFGDDASSAAAGGDYMEGNAGADRMRGGFLVDLMHGNGGMDEMYGDSGMDVMLGGADSDTMYGGIDADYMQGNENGDDMFGDDGTDRMVGGSTTDTIHGKPAAVDGSTADGADEMHGGSANDVMTGDNATIGALTPTPVGAETLHNESSIGGADTMYGDVGDDRLFGEFADDTMYGGQLNDYMEGNGGSDSMYGEDNEDNMIGGGDSAGIADAGETIMSGGAGIDYIAGDNAQITTNSPRNVVLLDLNSTNGDLAGNDILNGDGAEDVMYGQGEHDTMDGGAADDYMEGNTGTDSMQGGAGADDMLGGSGHDNGEADGFRELDFVDDESVAGLGDQMWGGNNPAASGDGVDFMAGDNANITRPSPGVRLIELYNVDFADITPDPDPILSGNDTMHGNAANDVMYGQGDNDTMFGDEDADYMEGNTGRDIMEGNADDDDMVGGSGRDNGGEAGAVRRLENAVDDNVSGIAVGDETDGDQMFGNAALDGNAAADADDYMAGDNAFITRNSPRSIELYDVPFADGPAINGLVSGDDFMHGNGEGDVMYGQGDLDQMFGDAGDDYMEGNSHDDYMEGNGDEDDMLGGSGHDNADDDVEPDDFRELRNVLDGRDTMFGNDGVDYMGGDNANILRAGGTKNFDGPSAGRSVELYDVQLADGAAVAPGVSAGDTMEGNAGNDVIFGQGNGSQPASQADPDDDIDNDRDGREDGDASDAADRGYDCNDGAADTTVFLADPDNDGNGDVDAADPQCQAATDEDADWQGDLIHGNDGHDYIEGNHGSDWMFGDGGEDDMAGGGSADDGKVYDAVTGDPIADRTAGGLLDGHDVMWGNEEDDSIVGDNGAHTRPTDNAGVWKKDSGGNGFDQFERTMTMSQTPEAGAAHGNDYLRGNEGHDDMFGQLGDDYMQGDAGEDAMLGDLGQVENEVVGGSGPGTFIDINPPFIEEYVDVPGTLKRVVTLYAHNTDVAGAGGGADTMLGNEGNDKMHGGPGPDLMQGNGDTPNPANASTPPGDFLFGGDGDDALWGGRGHDHLFGGWGNDFHDVAPRPYMDTNGDTVSDVPQDLPVWFELAGAEHNQGLDFTWGGRDKDAHQASFGRPGPRPGDRLIDAVGNTNIFYTCPGAYGEGVINRDELMPDMRLFLQELAAGDGAVETLDPNSSGGRELSILFPGDESGNPPYPGSPGHFTCPPSDPGVTAGAVTLSSQQITAGDQVTINAAVGNDAPAATGAVVVRFAANGVEIGRQTVEGIEEGGTETASQVWNTRNLHGPQTIEVTLDPDNSITGENEDNNAASLDANVQGTDAAIAPADVSLSRAKIVAGDKVDVSATVRNPSSAPAYDVVVKFTDNGAEIGSRTIGEIAPGGSATATVRWRTNKLSGAHTVAATADPANAIAETDESNNAAGVVANVIANKVKNGVFEPSVVTPTAPDAWTAGGTATTYVQVVDDECDWLPGAGSSSYWMSEVINGMTPGAPYEVGVRVRGGLATLAIKQYTEAGRGLKTVSFVLQPPAGEWFEFENTVTLDSRATQVQLLFYGGLNGIPSDFCNAQLSQAATATATR
jgi:Ca2+-binding RTX toxin-like protein